VHQGDVDVGHYFSYVKYNNSQWIWLDDTRVSLVSTPEMKRNSYGEIPGSSAYLVFYERFDAKSVRFRMANDERDQNLIDQIQRENVRLGTESVCFTSEFSDFVADLSAKFEFGEMSMRYLRNVLVRSQLTKSLEYFLGKLSKDHERRDEFLRNDFQFIVDVLCKCTNSAIQIELTDFIATFNAETGPDNFF